MTDRANIPYSEQYRLCAKDWVEKDSVARLLEETKTAVLSQYIQNEGDKPHNRAERDVKASEKWSDFITKMVRARETANLAKVKLKYIEMKYFENAGAEATARSERRM